MTTLYGSATSPFVRRLRIYSDLAKLPVTFEHLDIFSEAGFKTLTEMSPARKVPVLKDDDTVIYDSAIIKRYLDDKHGLESMTFAEENLVTVINACNDSLVELLLCGRSGLDTNQDLLFFKLQHSRIRAALDTLENHVKAGDFDELSYPSVCLICLLDWMLFRDFTHANDKPALLAWRDKFAQHAQIKNTHPSIKA